MKETNCFRPMGLPLFALELQAQCDPHAKALCELIECTKPLAVKRAIVCQMQLADLVKRTEK